MTLDAAATSHGAIQLWGVRKSFGRTDIIQGVDLAVRSGECHVLIGPNGAGKSTLFHLISGALRATGGRIALNGHDITRSSPSAISRRGLGRSFQTSNLFGRLTAFENARIGAFRYAGYGPHFWQRMRRGSPADMRALEVLDEVGLLDQRDTPASLLSYADQRALEIALALAGGQRILLFDEPTAGMNREETAKVISLLQQLRKSDPRRTFVLIEHDMDVVFGLADRISVLVYGQIIATGTPADIRADARVQEAYLGAAASHASSH